MNHAIRHHTHYAQASLAFRQVLAANPVMNEFQQRMQHYYEDVVGSDVPLPAMDVLAKGTVPDFAQEIPAARPSNEEREIINAVVHHHGREVTELMADYANWSRVAWRIFDTAYARQFKLAEPAYTEEDHLRFLRQVNVNWDKAKVVDIIGDLEQAAKHAMHRTKHRVGQAALRGGDGENLFGLQPGVTDPVNKELRNLFRGKLLEGSDAMWSYLDHEVWGAVSDYNKQGHYDTITTDDVYAMMNAMLIQHSPAFGQFYPKPGVTPDPEMPDRWQQIRFKLSDDAKNQAAAALILEQAQSSLAGIAEQLLVHVEKMRRGSFGAEEKAELRREFDAIYYNKRPYYAEDYLPKPAVAPNEVQHPASKAEKLTLAGWLNDLAHHHVLDERLQGGVMEEISFMRREACDQLLAYCEKKVNGVNDKREIS